MRRLKQVLVKSKHNPHYLCYYVRNGVGKIIQNYFPALYSAFTTRDLGLGHISGIKQLHVILRTTDQVMNINSDRDLEEIGIITRNDVIRVGGCSLFKAGKRFADEFGKEKIRITIIADSLSKMGMAQYREAAAAADLSFDLVTAKDHGNGPSFQTQVDRALQDSDDTLAFILEDDYLLDEDAFTTCFRIMRDHSNVIGMNPHFHPDRIHRHDTGKLVVIDGKLYGQIFNTCCTFFMPVSQMRRCEKYLRSYDGGEGGTVNVVWKKGICLSPIGWTMAEALHRQELSPVNDLIAYDTQDHSLHLV